MNVCALIGVLFALVAAALSIVQATLKQFVEVRIAEEVDEEGEPTKLSCSIAGLGVFETSYDSSCLSPELLAASRVPDEKFTAPTLEFKLLFPAQQNFVAEVLPVNTELLASLDDAVGVPGAASGTVGPQVAAVEELQFGNCSQYMSDAEDALDALFTTLNEGVIPLLVPIISSEGADPLIDALGATGLLAVPLGAPNTTNPLLQIVGSTFQAVANSGTLATVATNDPDCVDAVTAIGTQGLAAALDVTGLQCVGQAYNLTSQLPVSGELYQDLLTGMADVFDTNCAAVISAEVPALPVQNCLGFVSFQIGSTVPTHEISFVTNTGVPSVLAASLCDVVPVVCIGPTVGHFYIGVAPLLVEFAEAFAPDEESEALLNQLAQALNGVGQAFLGPLAPATLDASSHLDLIEKLTPFSSRTTGVEPFPDTFTEFYIPCAILQLSGLNLPSIPSFDPDRLVTCGFQFFFAGAAEAAALSENPLAEVVGLIGLLYGACQLAGLNPPDCGLYFPALFLNGAYQGEMDVELAGFKKDNPSAVFEAAVAACEDDETDLEKMAGAQTLIVFAIVLYVLTVLVGVISMAAKNAEAFVMILAGFLSIGAFAVNLGALLQVQSAPVYDNVGEPVEVNEAFYQTGLVPTLALVTWVFALVASALFFGGACWAMRHPSGDEGDEEVELDEVKPEKEDEVAKLDNAEAKAEAREKEEEVAAAGETQAEVDEPEAKEDV